MTNAKNTLLAALGIGCLVLVNVSASEACWCWKSRGARSVQAYPPAPYPYGYPYPTAGGSPAVPAARILTGDVPTTEPPGFGPVPIQTCPPGMVPVVCDTGSGLWRETTYANRHGCIHFSLVGTRCPGADKKGPKDEDPKAKPKDDVRDRLEPMVVDVQTRKFRRPNPGEAPHAYLPARYLGKPSALPKS
jgi:hypothetical protein